MSRLAWWGAALALVFWACDDSTPGTGTNDEGVEELDAGTGGQGGAGGAMQTMDMGKEPDGPEPDAPLPDMFIPLDVGPDGPEPDVYIAPDQGPDVGEPEMREGQIGEPCPRGYDQDCDPDVTEQCIFIGENEILPGVSAICSRGCDDGNPCGAGLCCYPDAEGDRCMPAGFCALLRDMGDACEDNADCPPTAPLCATEAGSGAQFCTFGCAAGGECPDGFCCDGNTGGQPGGAICKPDELCPEPCETDEDCPVVQHCVVGACVPRLFACEVDIDCPLGERCEDGDCQPLDVARLGQSCESEDVACDEGAPLCIEFPDDRGELCTYNCTFHRDCPATYCCADIGGLGRADSQFCADGDLCPPNLPCDEEEDCGPDEYCHFGQCQDDGPHDVPRGGACDEPGVCELGLDCVFQFAGGRVGRGDRSSFPEAGPGVCSERCSGSGDCEAAECCKIAQQFGSSVGVGYCVDNGNNVCDVGGGGGGGGRFVCVHPTHCNPALFDRCAGNVFFGGVCSRACEDNGDCPGDMTCDPRNGVCQPVPRCEEDDDCGDGNRCVDELCRTGARECNVASDCEDPITQRCLEGRCAPRARPCADDGECDADEVCFAGECEIAERPCVDGDDCRAGEQCIDDICQTPVLEFGDACANEDISCSDDAPICFSNVDDLPDGICTTGCEFGSDCPGDTCCLDSEGAGDPDFFVCAPDALCGDGGGQFGHRDCGDDAACLDEDFCHRGGCYDDGDGDADLGEGCNGPGDCNLMASDACVVPLEFGYGIGAVDEFAEAQGAGTCQPTCNADADCGSGCCRHAAEDGAAVGVCLDAAGCPDANGPGEFCFPGAHDECDPGTTDACIFVEAAEDSYCAATCNDDGDCGAGCCRDVEGANFCLRAEDCN